MFNLVVKSNYRLGDQKKSLFTLTLANIERNFRNYNLEGIKMPQVYLRSQYGNLSFHYMASRAFRFNVGPSYERYFASRPLDNYGLRERYTIEKYRFEIQAYVKQYLKFRVKYGVSNVFHLSPESGFNPKNDFHIDAEFKSGGYGLRLAYDFGAMANYGLYQYATDNTRDALNITPVIMRNYWNERIKLSLFTNLIYRFDLEYGTININPRIECYLGANWIATAGGTYSYTRHQYLAQPFGHSHYYLEFAIKKNWGRNEGQKWRKEQKRIRIQLFKDENGNGLKDRNESGVPNVKVRIRLTNSADMQAYEGMPVDIALVSNDKGFVSFNNLPPGFYEVYVTPLEATTAYFHIGGGVEKIELNKNQMVYIPFQKANRMYGAIDLKRQRFIKSDEKVIQLGNIKVTAYNNAGDSYSAFTDSEGNFVLFVPGSQVYHVRINNVFGNNFRIKNNDIRVTMPDMAGKPIRFEVVENNRPINFRKLEKPAIDSTEISLQKIKVLKGSIAHIEPDKADSVSSTDQQKPQPAVMVLQQEDFYVVINEAKSIAEAVRLRTVYSEQGISASFGYDDARRIYYIYSGRFASRGDARDEIRRMLKFGIRDARIVRYNE